MKKGVCWGLSHSQQSAEVLLYVCIYENCMLGFPFTDYSHPPFFHLLSKENICFVTLSHAECFYTRVHASSVSHVYPISLPCKGNDSEVQYLVVDSLSKRVCVCVCLSRSGCSQDYKENV